MYDRSNLKKFPRLGELAPEAFKAFVAFDEAVVKYGVIPLKYKELIAVAVALIAREFFVLVVSAGFFLVFGTARAQGPATQDDGKAHASDVAADAVLASRGQLRSER